MLNILFSRWELFFIDTDECATNTHNCHINAVCNNTEGSHNCTCEPGYSGDGSSCIGKNVTLFFVCLWSCVCFIRFRSWKPIVENKVVFFSNRDVIFGINLILLWNYLLDIFFSRWELSFIDVDECMINTHNCDINTVCNNTEGSHNCTCKPGYSGDGSSSCTGNNVFLFLVVYIYDWGVS